MPPLKWPTEPLSAYLSWEREEYRDGTLFFEVEGTKFSIPITLGPTYSYEIDLGKRTVYHVDVNGDNITISPSITIPGKIASPNPAHFRQRPRRSW
jgi:hypothetical protein